MVALLGAESTGKSTLASALAAHLCAGGLDAVAVPETLREWCTRAGRAPRPEEQLAIAQEHEARVDAACAQAAVVLADTSALMVAIHAGMLFAGDPLYRFALERQRRYDATLVCGLDIPWTPEGGRLAVDALLREHLQRAGVPFQVVYGQGPQRLQSAVQALAARGVLPPSWRITEGGESSGAAGWVWLCDKCSDPACEHRLFAKARSARP